MHLPALLAWFTAERAAFSTRSSAGGERSASAAQRRAGPSTFESKITSIGLKRHFRSTSLGGPKVVRGCSGVFGVRMSPPAARVRISEYWGPRLCAIVLLTNGVAPPDASLRR